MCVFNRTRGQGWEVSEKRIGLLEARPTLWGGLLSSGVKQKVADSRVLVPAPVYPDILITRPGYRMNVAFDVQYAMFLLCVCVPILEGKHIHSLEGKHVHSRQIAF